MKYVLSCLAIAIMALTMTSNVFATCFCPPTGKVCPEFDEHSTCWDACGCEQQS